MIYLDHNATTPIASAVLDAMMPYLSTEWGNPSSTYKFGSKLKGIIEEARGHVAGLIGAYASEVIFTSCATESNNTAIYTALKTNPKKNHIITSAVEHPSVLNYCMSMEKDRYHVTYLPVDRDGMLKLTDLENAITEKTALVSLMWANNETGVLFPVKEIAEICHSRGVLYHCDAVQAAGKVEINLKKIRIDYLSLTGHKLFAPKGIGVLYVRRKSPFVPLLQGGHQEQTFRGGTESVPLIIGMGKAAEIARKNLPIYDNKVRPLRDMLENGILDTIPSAELNGHKTLRLANTANITFHGIESEALLILLDQEGICASSGSACLANSDGPSHVIKAMKPESATSRQSIRFSVDTTIKKSEIDKVIFLLLQKVTLLKGN